jgi:hypothetical protein
MITPITKATMMNPVHIPALKIPPTTWQELNVTKAETINRYNDKDDLIGLFFLCIPNTLPNHC